MSGFLDRLAARAVGRAQTGSLETLRPRVLSRFEPGAAPLLASPAEMSVEMAPVEMAPIEMEEEAAVPVRRAPVEAAAAPPRAGVPEPAAAAEPTVPRRERPAEPVIQRRAADPARPKPAAGPVASDPPRSPASTVAPRQPEVFSVAWPVLDAVEAVAEAGPAPRMSPEERGPSRKEVAPPGSLEPRAKGPFPLGGGGLEKGQGQVGGGLREGNLDGGSPHPEEAPRPRLAARGDREREPRATANPLPTLARRGELPAGLPEIPAAEPDEPSETVIRINIGQIDVRMPQPAAPAASQAVRPAARPSGPRLTLADYLKARQERRR